MKIVATVCWLGISAIASGDALDHWEPRSPFPPGSEDFFLSGITYAHGLFVAVPVAVAILTSADGMTWDSGTIGGLRGVAYGSGTFIAVGEKSVLASPDAVTWSTLAWTNQNERVSTVLNDVAYGNGVFVAVGYDSTTFYHEGAILTSVDGGVTWTNQALGYPFGPFDRITYGDGVFVAVGRHVPSASSRNIATSTDGLTWTGRPSDPQDVFKGVTYGNGAFVAVGVIGSCAQSMCGFIEGSADGGVTWTRREITNRFLYGVTYGNGLFVVVGSSGLILTSPDGFAWTKRDSGTTNTLVGIAYGNRTFVAVGSGDTILQSGDISVPCLSGRRSTNGSIEVTITGEIGRRYRLQAASGLPATNWVDELTFTNAQPATHFLDITATNTNQRFYRAVSP